MRARRGSSAAATGQTRAEKRQGSFPAPGESHGGIAKSPPTVGAQQTVRDAKKSGMAGRHERFPGFPTCKSASASAPISSVTAFQPVWIAPTQQTRA